MNPKLRSDSVFTQLTSEQIELLEDWLFEEKLSYKDVIEKLQKEFGVKTSQTALGRYFRRLAEGRAQEWRIETIAQCLEALATAKGDGTLQAGLFEMANMHAVRLMTEEKPSFRELTGWLRAMTSAGAFEMKRVEIYESKEKERLAEIERKEKEAKKREEDARWTAENRAYWDARDAKRKATIAAKKAAAEKAAMSNDQGQMNKEKAKARAQAVKVEAVASEAKLAEATSPPEAEGETDGAASAVDRSAVVVVGEPHKGGTPNTVRLEHAAVESERGVADGLPAAGCPNDTKTSSTDQVPEPIPVAVPEVPPSGEIAAATKPDGLTAGERSGCFRIFRG